MTVRVALVGGPMYDHLYTELEHHDVDVLVHADHPTLNREVARILGAGGRIDLLATHSKYAPSQARWLRTLDGLVDQDALDALAGPATELCRFDGRLLCAPRLVDVRVMWVRSDRVEMPPDTWSDLVAGDLVFGFAGRESGAFGTFFELVVGAGGSLFDKHGRPELDSPEAEAALTTMCRLASRAPADLPDWHYDEVDAALLGGRVDAAAAWPGGSRPIRRSSLADVLVPHPYPAGPAGRVSYSGCHAWAIPLTCGDLDGALAVLHRLLGPEAQALDAAGGNVCAHGDALARVEPVDDVDARRLEITRRTISESMITYPPRIDFPAIEDAGWQVIQRALRGHLTPRQAIREMQASAVEAIGS